MKVNWFLFAFLYIFSNVVSAQWLNVGKADYNWGPFHVYTLSLYTETGHYEAQTRPLMLTFTYAKPIEGKNFAISLVKEMENLKLDGIAPQQYLHLLKPLFPDFSPNDVLHYIALADKGYFVLNDTILDHEFDPKFNDALIAIWLSPQTNFPKLQPKLLGKENSRTKETPPLSPQVAPLNEDSAHPELPPNYPLEKKEQDFS